MSDWRTAVDYGGHAGAPPPRAWLMPVTVNRETLMRIRSIQTTDLGSSTDSGWSAWGTYGVGVDWLLPGYSVTAGSSWTKTEVLIQVAAGIGRPWKIIWTDKKTRTSDGALSYTDNEQLLLPGTSVSILYDAPDGYTLQLYTAAALTPADGL